MNKEQSERLPLSKAKELDLISAMMGNGEPPDNIITAWEKFVTESKDHLIVREMEGEKLDIQVIIQHVLRGSYLEANKDLQYYAQKVKFYNDMKTNIRDELSKRREEMSRMSDYIDKLEEDLQSVGDDAQLATIDLQNALQKQQQSMQLISNVSKMLHDTAMAIIRNIK
jgi:hypothetical protein